MVLKNTLAAWAIRYALSESGKKNLFRIAKFIRVLARIEYYDDLNFFG